MPAAPLLHKVPSLIGWPGSPSMWITLPARVETTWPQPTPQKGQTVVVFVVPRVLSGGIAGAQPDCDKAPIATVPVVSPLRNWRRVGCGGSAVAAFSSLPRFISSSSLIISASGSSIGVARTLALRLFLTTCFISHIHSGKPAETLSKWKGDRYCTL